jgi:hypothetical protein
MSADLAGFLETLERAEIAIASSANFFQISSFCVKDR